MLNSLNVAQTGLNASKVAIDNVLNNLANENTSGYKKRVVQLSELDIIDTSFTGRGVSADSAYRVTSQYMYDNMMNENTKTNYYDSISSTLGNIEAMFLETDESGFSSDLDRYFQAIEDLRTNPNSEIFKTTYKSQGKVLVDSLQNLYSNIEKEENLIKTSLNENVKEVNTLISEIGSINEQLSNSVEATNDLLDKRDQLENELSQYVDIEVDRSDDYILKIGGQVAINNTNLREIDLKEEYTSQIDRFSTNPETGKPKDLIAENYTIASGDKITYKFNNEFDVSITIGSNKYIGSDGKEYDLNLDLDDDGTSDIVDESNYIRALSSAINSDKNISSYVQAYNGDYAIDEDGNIVDNEGQDEFLRLDAKVEGENGKFEGRLVVEQSDINNEVINRGSLFKNELSSKNGENKFYLSIYEKELNIKSGTIKGQTENLTTTSPNNKIIDYKEKLDNFARSLSDIYDKFVKTDVDEYIFGHVASDDYVGDREIKDLNLFSGSDVKSLKFNENAVNDLDQVDLDYMSQMQWKKDIEFDGFAQSGSSVNATSFSEFFQELRVNISSDKENNDFLLEAQEVVFQSLQFNFEQLTKVDEDEEMINFMKFQASYTANAKIITAVDEMIQTLLDM